MFPPGQLDGLDGVLGRADQAERGLGAEQVDKSLADCRGVLGDQDTDGIHASSGVGEGSGKASCWCSGPGSPRKKPWPRATPNARSVSNSASVSMPSAMME